MWFNKAYWSDKYIKNSANWDIGYAAPPICEYIDQLTDKTLKILIPGSGNSYEAEYLYNKGLENIYILEFVEEAVQNFLVRVPKFPKSNIISQDFFEHEGQYDLIIEQTFFCSLIHDQRTDYVDKMHQLLRKNGKLVGLLFDIDFNSTKPPFGGEKAIYTELFKEKFQIATLETAFNSIKPRRNNEFFIKALVRK